MGAVHLGRLIGAAGFSRTVAIKRLHRHLATNDDFVTMFMDEARIASRIHHTNVIPTLEVVLEEGELLLVMEYLDGEPLSRLQRASRARGGPLPVAIAVSVMVGALRGLHAAHEARSERGEPLGIVHRDVSPQNIMVGADGVARVVDFGIAKAASRATVTGDAVVKGKLTYMAPEQLEQAALDRRTDVFAAAIVLWELLTGQRLFAAEEAATSMQLILEGTIPAPGARRAGLPGGSMRWCSARWPALLAIDSPLPWNSPRRSKKR
jgi:serine/threonine-protein kinase